MPELPTRILPALLLGAALLVLAASSAAAQEFLGKFGEWNVIGYIENGTRYCYIHAVPEKQSGNYTRRGEPYLLIIRRPDGSENFSVTSGYPYKPDEEIEIRVGDAAFMLFSDGEKGWTQSRDDDKALIKAMRSGATLTVRGISTKGTYSLDTYSLTGVTAALSEIRASCGN
jgi:hypothetical protein